MKIVFRADASVSIGTGHVMRCLTLARALRAGGAECSFVCRSHPGDMLAEIRRSGFTAHALPQADRTQARAASHDDTPVHADWVGADWQEDARQTCERIAGVTHDWMVVDHYGLDAKWESVVRPSVHRLMVIDDLADRMHDCDLLLDQNFGRTEADYRELVPVHCRVMAGSSHVLLRPEFTTRRERSSTRSASGAVKHLLISMGGMDRNNATGEALTALQGCALPPDTRITVVLGAQAPALEAVQRQAASMKWPTEVHVGLEDVAGLLGECDLAIGSGGTSTYERIYMGVPAILRPIAPNQREPLQAMAAEGLFELYEDQGDLVRKIEIVLRDGVRPPPAVVRDGTVDISRRLLDLRVWLRPPRPLDVRRTYRWLQDDNLRRLFLMRQKPERRAHFRYWKHQLRDPFQHVFSICYDGVHVGNAGVKNIASDLGEAELWLYLGEDAWRGKGIGQQALVNLEEIIRWNLNVERAVLHVSTDNVTADRLYRRAGYTPVAADPRVLAAFGTPNVIKMEKRL